MIDELPLVGLLGALASGTTVVRGAAELRVKESDRIASVVRALRGARRGRAGAGGRLRGDRRRRSIRGGAMDSVGDHRLAMLGAVAGLVSERGGVGRRLRRRRRCRTPASRATSPGSGRCRRDHRHRRAGRRRQEHGRAGGRPAPGRRLPRHRGDVPRTHLARAAGARVPPGRRGGAHRAGACEPDRDRADRRRRPRAGDRPRRDRGDPNPRGRRPGLGGVGSSARCAPRSSPPSGRSCHRARGSPTGGTSGTVVCPDADLKVFLTASLQERARRRRADLRRAGHRDGRGDGARGRAPPRPRRQHPLGEPAADRARARWSSTRPSSTPTRSPS